MKKVWLKSKSRLKKKKNPHLYKTSRCAAVKIKAQKIQRYFDAKTHVNFKTHFSFFAVTVEKESEELLKIND